MVDKVSDSSLEKAPDDVWIHCLSFLEIKDKLSVAQVNNRFKKLADQNSLWQGECIQRWGTEVTSQNATTPSYKKLFFEKMQKQQLLNGYEGLFFDKEELKGLFIGKCKQLINSPEKIYFPAIEALTEDFKLLFLSSDKIPELKKMFSSANLALTPKAAQAMIEVVPTWCIPPFAIGGYFIVEVPAEYRSLFNSLVKKQGKKDGALMKFDSNAEKAADFLKAIRITGFQWLYTYANGIRQQQ